MGCHAARLEPWKTESGVNATGPSAEADVAININKQIALNLNEVSTGAPVYWMTLNGQEIAC
jgi:hypothetical protein